MEVVTFELDLRGTTLLQERSSSLKISKVLTVGLIHILCPTHGMLLLFFLMDYFERTERNKD